MIDLLLFAVLFFAMITAMIIMWGVVFKIVDRAFRWLGLL